MRSGRLLLELFCAENKKSYSKDISHWSPEAKQTLCGRYSDTEIVHSWSQLQIKILMNVTELEVFRILLWEQIPHHLIIPEITGKHRRLLVDPDTGYVSYHGRLYIWIGNSCKWLDGKGQKYMENLIALAENDPIWYDLHVRHWVAQNGSASIAIIDADELYRVQEKALFDREIDPATGQITIDGVLWSGISKSAPWLNWRGKSICALVNNRKLSDPQWYAEYVCENAGFLRGNGRWGNAIRLIRADILEELLTSLPPKRVTKKRPNEPRP